MSRHTPGPWRLSAGYHKVADGSPADWTIEEPRYGSAVAFLSDDNAGPRYERDANARLIAAAPELLEACEAQQRTINALVEIVEDARRTVAIDGSGLWAQKLLSRIDSAGSRLPEHDGAAAIAKARGEP